jgi:hypothetical protein
MESVDFDPGQSAVIAADGPERLLGEGEGQVEILSYKPERIHIQVETTGSGLLVLTDANYPGWQATIDGREVEIHQTDGLFRGVVVPDGRHDVVFTFHSPTYRLGLLITATTLLVWLLIWIYLSKTSSRRPGNDRGKVVIHDDFDEPLPEFDE